MIMAADGSSGSRKQEANTIVIEFSGSSSEDIRDLRRGEGKLFRRIGSVIEKLKASGEVGENIQPIIAVVKQKKSRKGLLG